MKRLLFEQNNGGNYPSSHYYYTFDSKEEYDAFIAELRETAKEGFVRFDTEIRCEPRVVVSDGFATYGGKKIKARGAKKWSSGAFMSWNYYYIDPTTIEQFEDAKSESWWA
jgi:hypothetical protein